MFTFPLGKLGCRFSDLYNALANTWFKLLRVKSCKNALKRNKNYFKLAGSLSYLFYFIFFNLLSTPPWGFSETNINSTGNKKTNKQTNKKYLRGSSYRG